ncbi:unnamed protein product, partial [Laminaria digitata]
MAVTRVLVATLLSYLAVTSAGTSAQRLPPDDAGLTASSQLVFSVDVLLDESADPVPLGIRDGQTVAQAAEGFCREHGLNEAMRTVLMPQLIGVLENGIAEAIGDVIPVGGDESAAKSATLAAKSDTGGVDSTSNEPLFTLGISLDGKEERMLSYYTGQDPADAAAAFCVDNLDPSSHSEAFTRCSEALSSSIIEKVGASNFIPSYDSQTTAQQQQQQQQQGQQASVHGREDEGGVVERGEVVAKQPLLTVPLNINGVETTLEMFEGAEPEGVANEFCRRKEFAFEGQSFNSCYSQIVDIAGRAMTVYNSKESSGELLGQAGAADPFTFKVPVTLAGLLLHAEYRASETPHVSALRFCGPNLRAIESALGIDISEEVLSADDDVNAAGEAALPGAGGRGGGSGRESLKEACAMVVEDAINAVLLGLRYRVRDA